MTILGLNLGKTFEGKPLRDGGVCLLEDDSIVYVVMEERVSRIKRAGGYQVSYETLMNDSNSPKWHVDTVAISTCCEPLPAPSRIEDISSEANVIPINHHLSHAAGVFSLSPYDEAIVVVIDAGGNTLEESAGSWWNHRREQSTYYVAKRSGIEVIDRDFEDPQDAGFGEIFRAFTYFLGWNSSQHAGKTMALSAYGSKAAFCDKPIFSLCSNGKILSVIKNNPDKPEDMIHNLFRNYKIPIIDKRELHAPIQKIHKDIAYWVQAELERALLWKIQHLIKKTGIKQVCLGGGVAYNCKLIGKVSESFGHKNIFVQPGSGDHGQCLGNAIYARYLKTGEYCKFNFQPYLGLAYDLSEITEILLKYPCLQMIPIKNAAVTCAKLIYEGNPICRFEGRSEYGPRALGNRSILADARQVTMKHTLNRIKGRDSFMPFAPSVISEYVSEYFEYTGRTNYMTTAVASRWSKRKLMPAVVHKDGTSRIHIVDKELNNGYFELINEFYKLSGIPMVLNTSFNRGGEPIVETVADAFESFVNLEVPYMLIDGLLIGKQVLTDENVKGSYFKIVEQINIEDTKRKLTHKYPDRKIVERNRFNLYHDFIDWLYFGRKTTTIRYRKDAIDLPCANVLPMFQTDDFSLNVKDNKYVGHAEITGLIIKKFGDLDLKDAINDGFESLEQLKTTISNIYSDITNESLVSIYKIYLNTNPEIKVDGTDL